MPDLRERIKALWLDGNRARWQLALALLEAEDGELYRGWGFATMGAYARHDLGLSSSTLMKYVVAARRWQAETPEQRALLERRSPTTVYEYTPPAARQVTHPQMRRIGPRLVEASAGVPKLTGPIVDALCSATTLIDRGLPNDRAVAEWVRRLKLALAAYERRCEAGTDPRWPKRRSAA